MVARLLLLTAHSDLLQAWRRVAALGPMRAAASAGGGLALVVAELWIVHRLASRLGELPPSTAPLVATALAGLATLVVELSLMVAVASAITLALPVLEGLEVDPWSAAAPTPPTVRALQAWWRVMAGLSWLLALALPPLLALAAHLGVGVSASLELSLGLVLGLALAAASGTVASLLLAVVVPRRVLLPLAWTGATAAVVAAVVWLRHLHPEQLAAAASPEQLLEAVATLATGPRLFSPAGWVALPLTGGHGALQVLACAAAALAVMVGMWGRLAPLAAVRLTTGSTSHARAARVWQGVDRLLAPLPAGPVVASRLRLLMRDVTQASQTLYLLGLGAVYVENLRALPLDDPLARELAGLINLTMAGLLAAALALRFAYPARLLEGEAHWWWSHAPVSAAAAQLAITTVALLPPLLLSGGLFGASLAVTGPSHATAVGWWLVPWQAAWLAALGVAIGPPAPESRHASWIDAALGGGGMLFLAAAVLAVLWTDLAAGRWVVSQVLRELDIAWHPGILLGHPALPAAVLTLPLALMLVRLHAHPARRGG